MVIAQFVIEFTKDQNKIALHLLRREDATDLEWQMALHIQELHLAIMENIGDVDIVKIDEEIDHA